MSDSNFDTFVKKVSAEKKRKQEEKEAFDPEKQIKEWLAFLDIFYEKIAGYLKEYIDSGAIEILSKTKKINEEFYGEYEVNAKSILIGNKEILLDPIGTMLIGAKGRVDMIGRREIRRFVLVDEKSNKPHFNVSIIIDGQTPPPAPARPEPIKWAWKLTSMPPRISYFDLTEESFKDALLAVANG